MPGPFFYPDFRNMGELIGGTPSDDRRSIIQTANVNLLTRGFDVGSGNQLATASITHTDGSASVLLRSSSQPFSPGSLGDDPFYPGPWSVVYDPSLGSLPTSQGWTAISVTGATMSGADGRLRFPTTNWNQYYRWGGTTTTGPSMPVGKTAILSWRYRYNTGTNSQGIVLNARMGTSIYGGATGITAYMRTNSTLVLMGTINVTIPLPTFAVDRDFEFWAVLRTTDIAVRPTFFDVYMVDVTGLSLSIPTDVPLERLTHLGQAYTQAANDYPYVRFGNIWDAGTNTYDWGMVRYWAGDDEWVGLGSVTQRRYWQAKILSPSGGTLSAVDIRNNATAPSSPSITATSIVGSNGVAISVAHGAGNEAVYARVEDADTAVAISGAEASAFVDPDGPVTVLGIGNVSDGSRKVRVTGMSDGGVPSSSVLSSAFTLPYVAPSVDITFDEATLDGGETSNMIATATGSIPVTLTKAGSPLTSGVPVAAVTANTPSLDLTASMDPVEPGDNFTVNYEKTGVLDVTFNTTPLVGATGGFTAGSAADPDNNVALTLSDGAINPGGSATLTAVYGPGVIVELDEIPLTSGVPVTAVTANIVSNTPPTAAPKPILVAPDGVLPAATLAGGTIGVYQSAQGTNDLADVLRLVSDDPEGVYVVSGDAIAYEDLVFDQPGDYALTDWALTDPTKWYKVRYTAIDGTYRDTVGFLGSANPIMITITHPVTHPSGVSPQYDQPVLVMLSEAVTLQGLLFERGPYTTRVNPDGSWEIELPRLAVAAALDGNAGALGLHATWALPSGTTVKTRLPNKTTLSFTELEIVTV